MSYPWFRLYSEFADDPKVQIMPESMQRRLLMLFCLRCKEHLNGDAEIAWALRISDEETKATKALFIQQGFIDSSWNILHWEDRQFTSDSSSERVKKYRDKRQSLGLNRGSGHLNDPALYSRDCNRCIYCKSEINLCIDHLYPIILGGTDHPDNLAVACKSCNSGKAGRTPEMAKMLILYAPAKERYENYRKSLDVTVTDTEWLTVTPSVSVSISDSVSVKKSFVLPPWIDSEAWAGFEEMRRKIRAPLTDRARNGIIKELQKLCPAGGNGAEILDQSTQRGWRGIFAISTTRTNGGNHAKQAGADNQRETSTAESYATWLSMSDEFQKTNPWQGPTE